MGDVAPVVPRHVGIIMDGNGRWATARNLARTAGHREGIEAAKRVVLRAIERGIGILSLYAFSTENWRRAEEEVSFIMALIAHNLRDQYDFYRANRVRVRHIGNLARLPDNVRSEIEAVTVETASNDAITVNLAVNYGGRDEIVRAVNRHVTSRPGEPLTEELLGMSLDNPGMADPDLVIRTGGELRMSNFLLWESAYSELYFSTDAWPDWDASRLDAAIADYGQRTRVYGGRR